MEIIEDFLPHHKFHRLSSSVLSSHFPWFYNPFVNDNDPNEPSFQFIHNFWNDSGPTSELSSLIDPVWDIVNPKQIVRAKLNLGTRDATQVEGGWHTDFERDDLMTAVLYLNDNNGYTLFEDGTKVESKANRFAKFPVNTNHTGVSHTDTKVRVVLNLNWLPYPE